MKVLHLIGGGDEGGAKAMYYLWYNNLVIIYMSNL